MDERALVSEFLRSSSEAAFRNLYAAHTPRLYLSLLRLAGGRESDAQDLLQETWIRAVRGLAAFRWESALSTWLFGIGLNAWREAARERRRGGVPLEALPEEAAASPEAEAGAEVAGLDLELAVRKLPDGYREVLVLHDIEGYTHEEIASLLGIAPGTSKSQLSRARENVRRRLDARREPGREETIQ
ncbi:MAG TPA: RNA polymerase sigma factor [Thermoanaerobaculia bacterium]